MKDVKYKLIDTLLYDYSLIEEKLVELSSQGWHLEKIGNLAWKFHRGEPKQVRYEILYSAAASAYNSRPTEAEEELAELCGDAGWELAASFAQVQVYRNEDPNATPLETDEVQRFENLRRNMWKHFIPQQALLIVLFAIQLLMHGSTAIRKPSSILSSSMMVFTLAAIAGILVLYSCILANDLLWLRRAGRAVEAGQPIPPNSFYRKFRWVMWGFVAALMLGLVFLVEPGYGLTILILAVVVFVSAFGTLTLTKRHNASKRVNIIAPTVVTFLVLVISLPLFSSMWNTQMHQEEFPLTLGQITGEADTDRLVIESGSSPLVTHGRYFEHADEEQIQYTLVDIHCPLFYDMILNEQEQDFIRSQVYVGDADIPDAIREILGADYLRRSTGANYDMWFICWDDRIVYFYADWILTDEQIAVIAEVLRP